jgi:hypothetical protein
VRNVKGVLFADYVRMIRSCKSVDFSGHLTPDDLPFLKQKIEPDAWYPMATFERLGNAILHFVARDSLDAVRMWGRFSADGLRAMYPTLVEPQNPVETLNRFRVLRATFFDFEALTIPMLLDEEAQVVIRYYMGMPAEEAASFQTMGFFERQLELAGATAVQARFSKRSWAGDDRTVLLLDWQMAPPPIKK